MEEVEMRDSHRMFLQHIVSKGLLNRNEFLQIYESCRKRFSEEPSAIMEDTQTFLRTINLSIKPFNLEIKKGISEQDGANYYCLVNTVESPISRLSSTYSQNELELFKKLVGQIVEQEDGKIGSMAALRLTDKPGKKMGKEEAQNFLNNLEHDKWIVKGQDGKISLSVRSILELDQYLKEMYPDFIKLCNLCHNICLYGKTCENCGIKIHLKCLKILFSSQGREKRCPSRDCRVLWGETAVDHQE